MISEFNGNFRWGLIYGYKASHHSMKYKQYSMFVVKKNMQVYRRQK